MSQMSVLLVRRGAGLAEHLDHGDGTGYDAVTIAVRQGLHRGRLNHQPNSSHIANARELFREASNGIDVDHAIDYLLHLIHDFPGEAWFQVAAINLMEMRGDPGIQEMHARLDARFPALGVHQLQSLRRTMYYAGIDRGRERLRQEYPAGASGPAGLLRYAMAAEELRDFGEADAFIQKILALPEAQEHHLHDAARLYLRRGHVVRAREIADGALERFPASRRLLALRQRLSRQIARIASAFPGIEDSDQHLVTALFLKLIDEYAATRPKRPLEAITDVGSVVLVGASLGPGGAERQLVNTAIGLRVAALSGAAVSGARVLGPVRVICRSVVTPVNAAFFLPELEAHGVQVDQYTSFPDFGGNPATSAAARFRWLLSYLPADVAEGTRKLADALRMMAPDIVHIWQDGAIVATYLAALMAGVPRIVLGLRTLPPSDRPVRHRAEYAALYRSAVQTPGVRLSTNTTAIAWRYAQWLAIDPGRFAIVPNGIKPPAVENDEATRVIAARFDEQTVGVSFTVGGIMRFDANKRPLLWAQMALEILTIQPEARFILVGDGPLRHATEDFVQLSGWRRRFLFLQSSSFIGFWLSKMDVVVSLSHQEGLPNNLIEAQLAGVPVVATPAGGSHETFIPSETGTLLRSCVDVNPVDVARAVCRWKLRPDERFAVRQQARARANSTFAPCVMLKATIECYRHVGS